MDHLLTTRLVEFSFRQTAEVAVWLSRLGLEVELRAGVALVTNPYLGFRTAIPAGLDPVTQAVCLGLALAGLYWPQLFPELLTEVNRRWTQKKYPSPPGEVAR